MNAVARFERKYLLTLEEYHRVRNAVMPFTRRDRYTEAAGGSYLVRSIYYDTRDYRAWYEKEDGDFGRIKLRIRAYTEHPETCDTVSVELKTKHGNSMVKYSTHVGLDEYREFERTGRWPNHDNEIVCEFERLLRVRSLVPVCLVQYRREGFTGRDRRGVRVTMDHNVTSTRAATLFPTRPILRPHRPKRSIFEVKTREGEPRWLQEIIKRQMLKMTSNSKYWQGIEIVRPNMVTPREVAP